MSTQAPQSPASRATRDEQRHDDCDQLLARLAAAEQDPGITRLCELPRMSSQALQYWRKAVIAVDRYLSALALAPRAHEALMAEVLEQVAAQIDWSLPDNAVAVAMHRLQQRLGDEAQRLRHWAGETADHHFRRGGSFPQIHRIGMKPAEYSDREQAPAWRPAGLQTDAS